MVKTHRENASREHKWKTHKATAMDTIQWIILEDYRRRLDSSQQWSNQSWTATHGLIEKRIDRKIDGRINGRIDGRIN